MLYADYVTTMQQMLGANDPSGIGLLGQVIPRMIEYAELRIYRELDFLTTTTQLAIVCTPGSRNITVPPGTFVVVEKANRIEPAGTSVADNGSRAPLDRVSQDFIDMVAGSSASSGPPTMYCFQTDSAVFLGPWPDANYYIEFIGTFRPPLLSASNTSDFISTYLPDLLVAASMIFGAGYQKNFGAQADDPKMAQSWETQYSKLKEGAEVEELRKKFMAGAYQPYAPSPIAVPPPS